MNLASPNDTEVRLPDGIEFELSELQLEDAVREAWRPRERLSVSEIAERHLCLSREYTRSAGLVSFADRPLLREIVDRFHPDDPVRTIVVRGPIQYGKTVILQAFATFVIVCSPGPFLWVTDTDEKAQIFSKKRFDRMVRDSPALRGLVAESKGGRSRDNSIHQKSFLGGDIMFVGAQSSSGVTSNTFRFAAIDEADDHGSNISHAGSSVLMALGRQTDFEEIRKTGIVSSPKVAGESQIDHWFDQGDQRHWHVPCIVCGERQPMTWQNEAGEYCLVWPQGHPDEAHYECQFCHAAWEDRHKGQFLPSGLWVPHRPDLGDHGRIASYGFNAMYMPPGSYSFTDLARDWESATNRAKAGDLDEMRTVKNKRLALSFSEPGEQLDRHQLADLVDPDWGEKIPAGVRVIVTGTDVHPYRRETMTLGIGLGWEMWILDYAVSLASPLDKTGWTELDVIRRRKWETEDGRTLVPRVSCVDARFLTQRVLEYCTPKFSQRVYAVMGEEGKGAIWPRVVSHSGRNKNKGMFYPVHVDTAKNDLYEHLRVKAPGPKRIHIPDRLVDPDGPFPDFLQQMCNERRTRVKERWVWKKMASHLRNEVWDTFVYCLAGAHCLVMGGLRLDRDDATEPAVTPNVSPHFDPRMTPGDPEMDSREGHARASDPAPLDDFWADRGG